MSGNETNQNTDAAIHQSNMCVNMESVNRITKLPVVESTIQTATSIYEKVKDYNSVTNWTLSTAESTVNKAIEVGKPLAAPVVSSLEGPIKKVDGMLCTGLDYVEAKVPAVKLPPNEMYTTTKDYVSNTVGPAVQSARAVVEPAVQSARDAMEPAVQAAKNAVEPAVQTARQMAEPLLQPAVEKAQALKDYGTQKVGEFLHHNHDSAKSGLECAECIEHVEKKKSASKSEKTE